MNIAILGGGAMGCLFGGYLSRENHVTVIDRSKDVKDAIESSGIRIMEKNGTVNTFFADAELSPAAPGKKDLVIVFVKSLHTVSALEENKLIIGKDTYLMTLQNGAGHEEKLLRYADRDHVIIGSTQHNSSVIAPGFVRHGGSGKSSIGPVGGTPDAIRDIAETFTRCGLECTTENNIQRQIWKKLFTNTAASSLTALFQVPLGFIRTSPDAYWLMKKLIHEAVTVADALGLGFDEDEVTRDVENVLTGAPDGFTSIYADIRDGRKSEVDTISGSVIEAAKSLSIDVPFHEMIVHSIHALEEKNRRNREK